MKTDILNTLTPVMKPSSGIMMTRHPKQTKLTEYAFHLRYTQYKTYIGSNEQNLDPVEKCLQVIRNIDVLENILKIWSSSSLKLIQNIGMTKPIIIFPLRSLTFKLIQTCLLFFRDSVFPVHIFWDVCDLLPLGLSWTWWFSGTRGIGLRLDKTAGEEEHLGTKTKPSRIYFHIYEQPLVIRGSCRDLSRLYKGTASCYSLKKLKRNL